MNTTW